MGPPELRFGCLSTGDQLAAALIRFANEDGPRVQDHLPERSPGRNHLYGNTYEKTYKNLQVEIELSEFLKYSKIVIHYSSILLGVLHNYT